MLPFADMSPAGDQEYFSDGISEEILTVLSKIRDLRVAARSSAFVYKSRELDLRQVGEELGVPYLLAGSVRKDGDQLRISAELVSASDGFRLWSGTYDRRLVNIFAIQTEIAEAITAALSIPLGLSREALVSPTLDMEAHALYLSGRAAAGTRGRGGCAAPPSLRRQRLHVGPGLGGAGRGSGHQPALYGGRERVDGLRRVGGQVRSG